MAHSVGLLYFKLDSKKYTDEEIGRPCRAQCRGSRWRRRDPHSGRPSRARGCPVHHHPHQRHSPSLSLSLSVSFCLSLSLSLSLTATTGQHVCSQLSGERYGVRERRSECQRECERVSERERECVYQRERKRMCQRESIFVQQNVQTRVTRRNTQHFVI